MLASPANPASCLKPPIIRAQWLRCSWQFCWCCIHKNRAQLILSDCNSSALLTIANLGLVSKWNKNLQGHKHNVDEEMFFFSHYRCRLHFLCSIMFCCSFRVMVLLHHSHQKHLLRNACNEHLWNRGVTNLLLYIFRKAASMSRHILAKAGNLVQDLYCHLTFKRAICVMDSEIRSRKEHTWAGA